MALLEVLHDHARLGQDEAVVLQDRDLSDRVLLVEPVGAVLEVDLDCLVRDRLLREENPNAGAVGAARRVVEREHAAMLFATPRRAVRE